MRTPGWSHRKRHAEELPAEPSDFERLASVLSATAADRVTVELLLSSGAAGSVDFRIQRDRVEVWLSEAWVRERCCGVIVREDLRRWLAAPGEELVFDEVALELDRQADVGGRLALTLPGVRSWTLTPTDADRLTSRI